MKQTRTLLQLFKSRTAILTILFISIVLGSSSCNDKATSGKLRAVNLSPDTESVDVFDKESTLFRKVLYTQASDYTTISNKRNRSHQIKVTPTDSFTVFSDQVKSFKSNKAYTLFVFDFAEKATVSYELDDRTGTGSGRAKLRFVHAAPSTAGVDLYVTAPNESLNGLTPTLKSSSFKRISSYMENKEGDYQIRATLKGDTTVVADSGEVSLSSNKFYTIAMVDKLGGGTPLEIVVISDN